MLDDAKFEDADLSGAQLDYDDFKALCFHLNDGIHASTVLHLAVVRSTSGMSGDELAAWVERGALLDTDQSLGKSHASHAIHPYVYGSL